MKLLCLHTIIILFANAPLDALGSGLRKLEFNSNGGTNKRVLERCKRRCETGADCRCNGFVCQHGRCRRHMKMDDSVEESLKCYDRCDPNSNDCPEECGACKHAAGSVYMCMPSECGAPCSANLDCYGTKCKKCINGECKLCSLGNKIEMKGTFYHGNWYIPFDHHNGIESVGRKCDEGYTRFFAKVKSEDVNKVACGDLDDMVFDADPAFWRKSNKEDCSLRIPWCEHHSASSSCSWTITEKCTNPYGAGANWKLRLGMTFT